MCKIQNILCARSHRRVDRDGSYASYIIISYHCTRTIDRSLSAPRSPLWIILYYRRYLRFDSFFISRAKGTARHVGLCMIYVWLVFFFLSSFRFPIINTTVVNGLSTEPETDLGIELRAGGPHRRFCMYAHNIIINIILFIYYYHLF